MSLFHRPFSNQLAEPPPPFPLYAVLIFALALTFTSRAAAPRMRIVQPERAAPSLLRNGDFEHSQEGKLSQWSAGPHGYSVGAAQGRDGSHALRGENTNATGWVGGSQTVILNRTNVIPLTVRGWSKAENVSGSPDSGYSLYVDLTYQDGTPLWGQTANFRTGTHDWQQRELLVIPEKPVKSLTLHCILRGHSGKAWFDDVSLEEATASAGAVVFQGLPIALERPSGSLAPKEGPGSAVRVSTEDGLELAMGGGVVQSLKLRGKEFAGVAPSGFLVRDAAAGSHFYGFEGGECPDLGLKLDAEFRTTKNHVSVQGRLSDTRSKDRAVTLIFALPVEAGGWRWGDDIRRSRPIGGGTEMLNATAVGCGSTGTMSLYPVAAIYSGTEGLALGLDMAHPAQYRLSFHPGAGQLLIAYDFGLVPETRPFPGAAEFRFVVFRFDPQWGFRAAFQKYMEIFPACFEVRSRDQGIWMPFTDVSTVRGWEDFGFKYHEGNNNVPWDDQHGVLSFRYTEPMTWWMSMEKNLPRTMSEALRIRDALAGGNKGSQSRMAQVTQVAAMWDDSGQPALSFRDTPWCDGAVWSLNPNPHLPTLGGAQQSGGDAAQSANGAQRSARPTFNAATVHWNDAVGQSLYGPDAKGRLDGEYLDSLEGYVTTDLNFRREHFRYSTVPLTFANDTKEPALFKGLAVYEFTRWISDEVHRLDKLMFANGVPYRLSFLCPWLDVLGTETDWLQNGKYRPASDSQMSLWRTMSGGKPYLLLMNTDYNLFTPELVEKYFQRSLFYGMFPSMFSHNAADNPYWKKPEWYDRDRGLFKKYIPLVKRVAEAGWHPVTLARCDNPLIYVERFGPDAKGTVYLTVLNDTATPQSGELRVEPQALRDKSRVVARDLVSGATLEGNNPFPIRLESQQAAVIALE